MRAKLSVVAWLCVALVCCGFSLSPAKSNPIAPPQEFEQWKSLYSIAPITILSATPTATGVAVKVRNDTDATVEYFEITSQTNRVFAGRCNIDVTHMNHPKILAQAPLSLAPGETRIFDFPVFLKGAIHIKMVLLSDGRGFLDDHWLRRLERAKSDGMLWDIDSDETGKHRVKDPSKMSIDSLPASVRARILPAFPRNVGKSFTQNCLNSNGVTSVACQIQPTDCRDVQTIYECCQSYGFNVTYLTNTCYLIGTTDYCGETTHPFTNPYC